MIDSIDNIGETFVVNRECYHQNIMPPLPALDACAAKYSNQRAPFAAQREDQAAGNVTISVVPIIMLLI